MPLQVVLAAVGPAGGGRPTCLANSRVAAALIDHAGGLPHRDRAANGLALLRRIIRQRLDVLCAVAADSETERLTTSI